MDKEIVKLISCAYCGKEFPDNISLFTLNKNEVCSIDCKLKYNQSLIANALKYNILSRNE